MGLQDIKTAVAELKKIKEKQAIEGRKHLTSEEMHRAQDLCDKIDIEEIRGVSQEIAGWLPEQRTKVHRPDPQDNNPDVSKRISQPGYELRTPGESKNFRSLYGSVPYNDFQWQDNEADFFQALFSGRFHPGLTKRAMTEGVPSDGGFLVPVEYSEQIHDVSLENELVMPMASVQPMKSNSKHIPAMEIGDHSSNLYGGFIAYYKGEGATLTEADPTVRDMQLEAKKLTGFLKLSNELVSDMAGGSKKIVNICGKGLSWYRDKAFLKGSGAGEPLGILNAGCLKTISKEAGQAAATVVYENLTKMMAGMHPACFNRSVWVAHQSTIPQLLQITIAIGTGGSHVQAMNESNGKFTLLTRPVIFTEKTEPLGTKGDLLLADFSQYVVGLREEMRIDFSPHVYFTTDHLAARLIERHDGQPLWNEELTLEDGSTTVSPFVTLEARS